MTPESGERSKFFPAIEKRHGEPIAFWISRINELGAAKYPEQIAYLRENYAFSQAHANAVVMYVRGSTTSKRFTNPEEFFATITPVAAQTMRDIFTTITVKFPRLELVMAWNQPMLRLDGQYVIGVSVAKNHITVNPFSNTIMIDFADKLSKYTTNKKTFQVPIDWKIDASLLHRLVKARLGELA